MMPAVLRTGQGRPGEHARTAMTETPEHCQCDSGRPTPRRRRPWRWGLAGAAALAAGLLGWQGFDIAVGANWHAVLPGRVYRSAQLSERQLEEMAARYGIRTVVNLRGCCYPEPWYVAECRATHHNGISQEDVSFSAGRYPSRTELRRLLEVLDHSEYPIVLHCRRGSDRTGMVAAMVLLLQPGVGLAEARRQLGPRFGHFAVARTAYLDAFLDLYEDWLREVGRDHAPAVFRDWLLNRYRGGHCSCVFEQCPRFLGPIPPRQPQAIAVRVRNDGHRPWHFRPTDNAGVHLGFVLYDLDWKKVATGRAGLFEADVPPGGSIDLTVALPGVRRPGTYRLFLDMLDEHQGYFYQIGSEPMECEVRVGA
jgi:hypothetical protein